MIADRGPGISEIRDPLDVVLFFESHSDQVQAMGRSGADHRADPFPFDDLGEVFYGWPDPELPGIGDEQISPDPEHTALHKGRVPFLNDSGTEGFYLFFRPEGSPGIGLHNGVLY